MPEIENPAAITESAPQASVLTVRVSRQKEQAEAEERAKGRVGRGARGLDRLPYNCAEDGVREALTKGKRPVWLAILENRFSHNCYRRWAETMKRLRPWRVARFWGTAGLR